MAAASKRSENSGIIWTNSGFDGEVKADTSFKMGAGSKGKHTKKGTKTQTKRNSVSRAPVIHKPRGENQVVLQSGQSESYFREEMFSLDHRAPQSSESTDSFIPFSQLESGNSKAKSGVCLKDLCPEDKRRIANLIEELARVTEEKEESMQRYKNEQGSAERKIQQLEEQNVTIAQERENLQQQFKECQELLRLYQQYLLLQQAKLNESVQPTTQPATSKVLSGEETHSRTSTSRANGSLFDGSYFTCATTEAQSQVYMNNDGQRGAAHPFQNSTSVCCTGDGSPNCRPVKQHVVPKRECRELHLCSRCEHSQNGVCDAGYETQQQRSDAHQWNGNCYIHNKEEIERFCNPTLPHQTSHEEWEVKKHQLLLQKLQLEMEKERIQARLAEQEEMLRRENQLLRQSCLETSSLQQAIRTELKKSKTKEKSSESRGPSREHLTPSVPEDVSTLPADQTVHEKHSQTVSFLQTSNNSFKMSKKDMATSPVIPPAVHTSTATAEKNPEPRLDLSSVELLDIFNSVSASSFKPATRRHKTSHRKPAVAPKSPNRALLTPVESCSWSTQQNVEESQILEDIFFIF